jgi:hypothetical protein
MKKGVELSLNFVIIAVIALAVLVLVIFLLMGGWKNFTQGTNDCASTGGQCLSDCGTGMPKFGTCESGLKCCVADRQDGA